MAETLTEETRQMKKYSKLVGSVVGALVGIAAAFGLNVEAFTPEVQASLIVVLTAIGTFMAPANA
jgi:hypothetical protein